MKEYQCLDFVKEMTAHAKLDDWRIIRTKMKSVNTSLIIIVNLHHLSF